MPLWLRNAIVKLRLHRYSRFEKVGLWLCAGLLVVFFLTCEGPHWGDAALPTTDDPVLQTALRVLPQAALLPNVPGWVFSDTLSLARVEDAQQAAQLSQAKPVWTSAHHRLVRWDVPGQGVRYVGLFLVGERGIYQLCPAGSQNPLTNPSEVDILDLLTKARELVGHLEQPAKP